MGQRRGKKRKLKKEEAEGDELKFKNPKSSFSPPDEKLTNGGNTRPRALAHLQLHESEESHARLCPPAIAFFPASHPALLMDPIIS